MVMLELEAMHLDRVKTDLSGHYVDHNLIQADYKNPDDHLFLCSAAQRFGLRFSRPGNGVSHPLHQEPFGKPGATLLGSDSHTPAAGGIGMLAIGAGGIEVAMAMAGRRSGGAGRTGAHLDRYGGRKLTPRTATNCGVYRPDSGPGGQRSQYAASPHVNSDENREACQRAGGLSQIYC